MINYQCHTHLPHSKWFNKWCLTSLWLLNWTPPNLLVYWLKRRHHPSKRESQRRYKRKKKKEKQDDDTQPLFKCFHWCIFKYWNMTFLLKNSGRSLEREEHDAVMFNWTYETNKDMVWKMIKISETYQHVQWKWVEGLCLPSEGT